MNPIPNPYNSYVAAQPYLCKAVVHAGVLRDLDVFRNPRASDGLQDATVPLHSAPNRDPRALDLSLPPFYITGGLPGTK